MAAKKKTPTTKSTPKDAKYGELATELEEILAGIEEGEIDIDDLSEKVERATELIKACREKLNATQIRVQKVVSTLEEDEEEDDEWEEDDEAEDEDEEEGDDI